MTELLAIYYDAADLWCYKCRKRFHTRVYFVKIQEYDISLMSQGCCTWICHSCIHEYMPLHLSDKPIYVEEYYTYHREVYSDGHYQIFRYDYTKQKL